MPAGPTTIMALISALQVGFQNAAIAEDVAGVQKVLENVKLRVGKLAAAEEQLLKRIKGVEKAAKNYGVHVGALTDSLRVVGGQGAAATEQAQGSSIAVVQTGAYNAGLMDDGAADDA